MASTTKNPDVLREVEGMFGQVSTEYLQTLDGEECACLTPSW